MSNVIGFGDIKTGTDRKAMMDGGIFTAELTGKRIKYVAPMSKREADEMGWSSRPFVIYLDSGERIIAFSDDEGNNGGSLVVEATSEHSYLKEGEGFQMYQIRNF